MSLFVYVLVTKVEMVVVMSVVVLVIMNFSIFYNVTVSGIINIVRKLLLSMLLICLFVCCSCWCCRLDVVAFALVAFDDLV